MPRTQRARRFALEALLPLYKPPPPPPLPPHNNSGVNDTVEDAQRLAEMTEGLDCVVNLIEFNTHEGAVFKGSPRERVRACVRLVIHTYVYISLYTHIYMWICGCMYMSGVHVTYYARCDERGSHLMRRWFHNVP